jgi:hypothetical protein
MPSAFCTDASGMARAPLADSPNMKAKAMSLFIGVSPCIAAVRRAVMSRQGSAVKREFGYFFASRHRSSGSASSPRHRRFESGEVSSAQMFQLQTFQFNVAAKAGCSAAAANAKRWRNPSMPASEISDTASTYVDGRSQVEIRLGPQRDEVIIVWA